MRAREFINEQSILDLIESATGGATAAGSIASVAGATGMLLRRMPTEPNLFGYIPAEKPKSRKKKTKSSR